MHHKLSLTQLTVCASETRDGATTPSAAAAAGARGIIIIVITAPFHFLWPADWSERVSPVVEDVVCDIKGNEE